MYSDESALDTTNNTGFVEQDAVNATTVEHTGKNIYDNITEVSLGPIIEHIDEKIVDKTIKIVSQDVSNSIDKVFVVIPGKGSEYNPYATPFPYIEDKYIDDPSTLYINAKDWTVGTQGISSSVSNVLKDSQLSNDAGLTIYSFSAGTRNSIADAVAVVKDYNNQNIDMPITHGQVIVSDTGAYIDNSKYARAKSSDTSNLSVEDCKTLADSNIGVSIFQHHGENKLNPRAEWGGRDALTASEFVAYENRYMDNGTIVPKLVEAGVEVVISDVNYEQAQADGLFSGHGFHITTDNTVQIIYTKMYDGDEDALDPLNNPYITPYKPVLVGEGDNRRLEVEKITSYHDLKAYAPGYYENWLENNNEKILGENGSLMAYQAGNGLADKANNFNKNDHYDPYTTSTNYDGVSIEYQSILDGITDIKKTIYSSTYTSGNGKWDILSNTSVPACLLSNQEALFNASSHLLNDIWADCDAITSIARNYENIDTYIANNADQLSNIGVSTNFVIFKDNFLMDYISQDNLIGNRLELFSASDDYAAMKISASDFDSCLNVLKINFERDNDEACNTRNVITSLLSSLSSNEGEIWGPIRDRLGGYNNILTIREGANNLLMEAYEKAANYVKEYMAPYDSLNGSDIPIIEGNIKTYENIINCCIRVMTAMEPKTVTASDGTVIGYVMGYKYSEEERSVAKHTKELYEAKIVECKEHIEKIKGLPAAMKEAEGIINDATLAITNLYVDPINDIQVLPIITNE